jgi:predicted metalloprotease
MWATRLRAGVVPRTVAHYSGWLGTVWVYSSVATSGIERFSGVLERRTMILPSRVFRSIFAIFTLAVLLAAIPVGPASARQADDDRIQSVTSAAIEMSRQMENGDFLALYDRLHPDIRNVLPRQDFLDWAASGDLPIPADDPVVSAVTFAEWTWPVGDERYDEAATVAFTQAVDRDGSAVNEPGAWTFVSDGQRWRWFPDLTGADIEGLHLAEEETPSAYEPAFRQAAYARIDRFWENIFTGAGLDYTSVRDIVAVTEEPLETACGVEHDISQVAIYYCTGDSTIYFDPDFRRSVIDATGSYGWTMIVAHEWGHHVQSLLGIDIVWDPELDDGLYPIEIELQSDCLAGLYTQDALAEGEIDDDDVEAAVQITGMAGDASGTSWDDYTAHGTGDQRVESFFTGFEDGFTGCNLSLAAYAG